MSATTCLLNFLKMLIRKKQHWVYGVLLASSRVVCKVALSDLCLSLLLPIHAGSVGISIALYIILTYIQYKRTIHVNCVHFFTIYEKMFNKLFNEKVVGILIISFILIYEF